MCVCVCRFANTRVVQTLCSVLQTYQTNSEHLNHSLVRLLYEVCMKQKMVAMLYQLSVFQTLSSILNEPQITKYKVVM